MSQTVHKVCVWRHSFSAHFSSSKQFSILEPERAQRFLCLLPSLPSKNTNSRFSSFWKFSFLLQFSSLILRLNYILWVVSYGSYITGCILWVVSYGLYLAGPKVISQEKALYLLLLIIVLSRSRFLLDSASCLKPDSSLDFSGLSLSGRLEYSLFFNPFFKLLFLRLAYLFFLAAPALRERVLSGCHSLSSLSSRSLPKLSPSRRAKIIRLIHYRKGFHTYVRPRERLSAREFFFLSMLLLRMPWLKMLFVTRQLCVSLVWPFQSRTDTSQSK